MTAESITGHLDQSRTSWYHRPATTDSGHYEEGSESIISGGGVYDTAPGDRETTTETVSLIKRLPPPLSRLHTARALMQVRKGAGEMGVFASLYLFIFRG